MSDIAIRVEGLGKQYRIGGPQARYKTIRESLVETVQAPFRRLKTIADFGLRIANREAGNPQSEIRNSQFIWALKDVSFEVQRGKVVGIPSTSPSAGSGHRSGHRIGKLVNMIIRPDPWLMTRGSR